MFLACGRAVGLVKRKQTVENGSKRFKTVQPRWSCRKTLSHGSGARSITCARVRTPPESLVTLLVRSPIIWSGRGADTRGAGMTDDVVSCHLTGGSPFADEIVWPAAVRLIAYAGP